MGIQLVPVSWLQEVMTAALAARGLGESQRAEVVAGVLFGSLRGIDSHGVALFRTYLDELACGRAQVSPRLSYRQRRPAMARLDAGGALGIVAGFEATRKAAALAKDYGVGLVVVANSNHFGAASIYSMALAEQGFIGLAMTNSDALVVPTNGRVPRLGTNPISMAAAGKHDDMFCTDLATSQGSFLRSLAPRAERRLLPGVLADADGRDTISSGKKPVALLPLGGHKGQCLGMMISILCSVLGEAPFDWEIPNLFEGPFDRGRQISHLIAALDVSGATEQDAFCTRLSSYLAAFRTAPAQPGLVVSCPGDAESAEARRRIHHGVPMSDDDYAFLQKLSGG